MRSIKKILITGASGFIGAKVSELLCSSYQVVRQYHCAQSFSDANNDICAEISSNTDWYDALTEVDTVIHLAAVAHNKAIDPNYINEVNVKGTINLAQQAAQSSVKRFIFMSSIGVLGNNTKVPFDENHTPFPHSQYTHSKFEAEKALLKIAKETGLEVVIIRPVLVYGENAPGNFGKLVNLVNKVRILPFGLCKNKRSFVSIDNLVDFISVCVTHPKAKNEIFCIADGLDVSIRQFTDGIAKGLNKPLVQIPIPMFAFKLLGKITGKADMLDQLVGDLQVDSSKARKLLNWTPPFTMVETLRKLTNTKKNSS